METVSCLSSSEDNSQGEALNQQVMKVWFRSMELEMSPQRLTRGWNQYTWVTSFCPGWGVSNAMLEPPLIEEVQGHVDDIMRSLFTLRWK